MLPKWPWSVGLRCGLERHVRRSTVRCVVLRRSLTSLTTTLGSRAHAPNGPDATPPHGLGARRRLGIRFRLRRIGARRLAEHIERLFNLGILGRGLGSRSTSRSKPSVIVLSEKLRSWWLRWPWWPRHWRPRRYLAYLQQGECSLRVASVQHARWKGLIVNLNGPSRTNQVAETAAQPYHLLHRTHRSTGR